MEQATDNYNDKIRETAMLEVQKDSAINGRQLNPIQFIQEVSKKFIELQLDAFPMYCQVARMQNKLKQDELRSCGRKGKYTDSLGWSENYTFKHDFEIPNELYLFMQNLVYRDFWSEDNEKIWRKFMLGICKGYDPMELLMGVKAIYGSNKQELAVV